MLHSLLIQNKWLFYFSHLKQAAFGVWDVLSNNSIRGLFNGNIAVMLTDNSQGLLGMGYQYDALHRIKDAKSYLWDGQWTFSGQYSQESTYDPDGNIQFMKTEGPMGTEDDFEYRYYDEIPNRLRQVKGLSSISNLPSQTSYFENYSYDAIGNLTGDESEGTAMSWDVYGKLRTVTGVDEGTIVYKYDPQGNRLIKARVGGEFPTDIYVRDASGNIIAIYEKEFHLMDGAVLDRIKEFDLYGSSRLGVLYPDRTIHNTMGDPDPLTISSYRNRKSYELSNHLGNVLNTVYDRKVGQDDDDDGISEYYVPHIRSSSDYYPFGLEMPGRSVSAGNHRFGFNGKEKDPSMSSLTHYDYGFRIYNPAIGRFLSVDPLTQKRSWVSPLAYVQNNPLNRIDPTGALDDWVQDAEGNIKWDKNAISQATTKAGETYLGKDLTFTFNSYINGTYDGPKPPWGAEGNKLTSTISIKSNTDADNNLLSVDVKSSYIVGETGGLSLLEGRDYFPGLSNDQNKSIILTGVKRFTATFEQHASVPSFEAFGLNMLGYDVVNVAQKLTLDLSGNNLSVTGATDVFPSATLGVNGVQLFQYNQPSFKATHGRDTRTIIGDNGMGGSTRTETTQRRPAPSFYNRYPK